MVLLRDSGNYWNSYGVLQKETGNEKHRPGAVTEYDDDAHRHDLSSSGLAATRRAPFQNGPSCPDAI